MSAGRSAFSRLRRGRDDDEVEPSAPAGPSDDPDSVWFWNHYDWAAGQTLEFLAGAGVSIEGKDVADVGCGDGFTDLGIARQGNPSKLVGFDVNLTNVEHLRRRAREEGVDDELPSSLQFFESSPTRIPAADASFDVVLTWSAFEHVGEPVSVLREIRRVLRPHGALFLQLWPFFHSERGSHLELWFPDGFHHLLQHEDEVAAAMRADPKPSVEWTEYMLKEFRHLNKVTLDELQRAVISAGFYVARVELISHTVNLRPELMRYPLSALAIAGVKLIAAPS